MASSTNPSDETNSVSFDVDATPSADTRAISEARRDFFQKVEAKLDYFGMRRSFVRDLLYREAEVVLACFNAWLPKRRQPHLAEDEATRAARLIMIRAVNRELAYTP